MRDIETVRTRLDAAAGLADTLAAGWDAFVFVQAAADAFADQAPATFAAFMLAAAAAASGRDALGFAPSMPPAPGLPPASPAPHTADAYQMADELACLASALGIWLIGAAGQAENPEDRQACENAARQAGQISNLLGLGR